LYQILQRGWRTMDNRQLLPSCQGYPLAMPLLLSRAAAQAQELEQALGPAREPAQAQEPVQALALATALALAVVQVEPAMAALVHSQGAAAG
jgi:hypothetical protein